MVDTLMTERKKVMNFLEEETEPDRNSEHGRKRSTDEHGQSSDVDEASPRPKQRRIDSRTEISRNSEKGKEEFETKSKTPETENGKANEPMSVEDDSSVDEPSKDEGIGSKETGMDVVDLTSDKDDEEEESKTKILDQKKKMLLKKMLLAKMKAKSAGSDESSSDEESSSGDDSGEEEESNDSDVIVEKVVERPKELFQNSVIAFKISS